MLLWKESSFFCKLKTLIANYKERNTKEFWIVCQEFTKRRVFRLIGKEME
jgi:hypothetical protein